ncbi:MAG: hypothetical protein WKF96_07670 [Solirubrobacteraceae bacterium]
MTPAGVDTTTALPNFRSGRQTDVWLAARIPDMPDDDLAAFCLYIKVTKDWKPREIRDRVEIHRRPSGEQ